MPFGNPILGGDNLVRPQMQSPNFVAGVSGWIIRKDGSVEFNDIVARGSVVVGPDPGAHVIIDAATDSILVYNSSNQLIAAISPKTQTIGGVTVRTGIQTFDATNPDITIRMVGNQIQLLDQNAVPTATASLITPDNLTGHGGQTGLAIESGSVAGNQQSALQLFSESADALAGARILVTQQNDAGTVRQGGLIQATNSVEPFFSHTGLYNIVTNGAGFFSQAHNCAFTPKWAQVTQAEPATGAVPIHTVILETGFGSANFQGEAWFGAALFTSNNYDAYIEFRG